MLRFYKKQLNSVKQLSFNKKNKLKKKKAKSMVTSGREKRRGYIIGKGYAFGFWEVIFNIFI